MRDLRALTIEEMEDLVVSLGEKKFRAKQIFRWVEKQCVTDIREMRNLPGDLLSLLAGSSCISRPEVLSHQKSSSDGTEKFLFGFSDGNSCESVLMRYKYGNTVCVSTQVGCKMGCSFCASGLNGIVRDLDPGEIVSQIMEIESNTGEKISRVVFMGTGEPFDNYENVKKAIRILHEKEGRNMSMRNITVSTCGIIPVLASFAEDFPEANLAISLHAPNQGLRESLMPVASKYPLDELMEACDSYARKTNRRVSYEYALIKGKNDGEDELAELADLLKGRLSHVNLIPLNEVGETGLISAGREKALIWKDYLDSHGVPATVRRQLGADIDGACGQLRNREGAI